MARAHRSALFVILGCLLLYSSPARAQDAQGNTFNLELFRPAVDSKGYITVNASQILGHLDFSLGLIGSYAHNVLNLSAQGNQFNVEHYLTPQLQGAVGFFKWVELGVSLPTARTKMEDLVRLGIAAYEGPKEFQRLFLREEWRWCLDLDVGPFTHTPPHGLQG